MGGRVPLYTSKSSTSNYNAYVCDSKTEPRLVLVHEHVHVYYTVKTVVYELVYMTDA